MQTHPEKANAVAIAVTFNDAPPFMTEHPIALMHLWIVTADAVWYGRVTLADADEIIESHIVGGKPVERLRLPDSCLNTPSCEHKLRLSPKHERQIAEFPV